MKSKDLSETPFGAGARHGIAHCSGGSDDTDPTKLGCNGDLG